MEQKTHVITLSSTQKGEADKLVRLFSSDLGMINATVKGARKQGSKLGCCTFTFALSEVVLNEKGGFYTVIAADLVESFKELSADIEKFEYASAIAEALEHFSRGDLEPNKFFVLTLQTYKLMAFSKLSEKLIFMKFLLEILKLSGYALDFDLAGEIISEQGEVYLDLSGQFMRERKEPCLVINNKALGFLHAVEQKNISGFDKDVKEGYDLKLEEHCLDQMIMLVEGLMNKKFKSIFRI